MIKSFRNALSKDNPLKGILISVPSCEMVEMISNAGFDWIFLDMEHSPMSHETLLHLLRCVSPNCLSAVRVPEATSTDVARVLDAGAEAVIFPRVSTEAEARHAVSLCKYPPEGLRGVGMGRGARYGKDFNQYLDEANDSVACIVQIEDATAVQNAAAIAAVPGVDALFIGPYDLSMSMGLPGEVTHPDVQQAIASVARLKAPGLALGIFTANPETMKQYTDQGFRLLAGGIDTELIRSGAQRILDTM